LIEAEAEAYWATHPKPSPTLGGRSRPSWWPIAMAMVLIIIVSIIFLITCRALLLPPSPGQFRPGLRWG
jgi:hypothetical protein